MDENRLQHNNAVVTRMYYSERMVEVLFGFASIGTAVDAWFIQQGYFAKQAKARIPLVSYWYLHLESSLILIYFLLFTHTALVLGIRSSSEWSFSLRAPEASD